MTLIYIGGGNGHRLNLTGTWYAQGSRSQTCSIRQRGNNLQLTNESGDNAERPDEWKANAEHQLEQKHHRWNRQQQRQPHQLGQRNLLDTLPSVRFAKLRTTDFAPVETTKLLSSRLQFRGKDKPTVVTTLSSRANDLPNGKLSVK